MTTNGPELPLPRGSLSEFVIDCLREPVHPLPPAPAVPDDPLGGDDFHLALYVLYELVYRGFAGVDPDWEWDPSLISLRSELERGFEAALRHALPPEPDPIADVPGYLADLVSSADGPPLSRHLEMHATLDQFREFAVHRSAYQLKEADPHSFAIPRLWGRSKVALVEVQFDEYGSGRPDRLHARLFADTMDALGLDSSYGAYLDRIPGTTLATVNMMSMFGLHRRLRGALVGNLAVLEMDSSLPNRRYGNGLRRLGCPEATGFYDEHVEADAVHEAIAAHDLAGALAVDDPAVAPDILFGARATLLLDAAAGRHVLGCFERGVTSLRAPLAEPAPAAS